MKVRFFVDPVQSEYEATFCIPMRDMDSIPKPNWDYIMDKLKRAECVSGKLNVLVEMAQLIENMQRMERREYGTKS